MVWAALLIRGGFFFFVSFLLTIYDRTKGKALDHLVKQPVIVGPEIFIIDKKLFPFTNSAIFLLESRLKALKEVETAYERAAKELKDRAQKDYEKICVFYERQLSLGKQG